MGSVDKNTLLATVQGDVLAGGIPKKSEQFLFFSINDPNSFCQRLGLPATLQFFWNGARVAEKRIEIDKAASGTIVPVAIANISFSATGLAKMQTVLPSGSLGLGGSWKSKDLAFFKGMEADSLGDSPTDWDSEFRGKQIDGLIIVAGTDPDPPTAPVVQPLMIDILAAFSPSMQIVKWQPGAVRTGAAKDHEHFGFNDGISQPTVEGIGLDNSKVPDNNLKGDPKWNTIPQNIFMVQDANGTDHPQWMANGSFLVFRKLEQDVDAWEKMVKAEADKRKVDRFLLGAKIVGRWQSGCPVMVNSTKDQTDQNFANTFNFTDVALANTNNAVCPLGAHIQKTNPFRGDNSLKSVGRILRRGIPYGGDFGTSNGPRGLLFACYQSSIENGFRTIQNTWTNDPNFPGKQAGIDMLMGNQAIGVKSNMTVNVAGAANSDPLSFTGPNPFVKSRGGEYFFTPTVTALAQTLSLPKAKA